MSDKCALCRDTMDDNILHVMQIPLKISEMCVLSSYSMGISILSRNRLRLISS